MQTGTDPSWPRVKQILGDALELPSGHRSAFVQQASEGDQQLEAKLLQMLRGYDTSTLLLDDPSTNVAQALHHVASQATEELVGTSIGRYKLLRLLGRGGMGAVYEAHDAALQRTVAIKLMPGGLGGRSSAKRLEREAKLLARLKHPTIAEVYEAGACSLPIANDAIALQGSTPYIAMEYVPRARSLHTFVRQEKLSVRERVKLIASACEGVQHAHQRGVIHRDLKPDNVLVAPDGSPKIIDFGIARIRDESDTPGVAREAVTMPGQLLGTLRYMSPEQASGKSDDVDARADVYALGLMLYELLTDKPAFDDAGLSMPQALAAIGTQMPAKPSELEAVCKGDLDIVVMKSLAKAPSERYQSVSELRSDLLAWLDGLPIAAVPPSTLAQVRSFARRNKPIVFAACGVAIALAGATVVSTIAQFRAQAAQAQAEREAKRAQKTSDFLQGMLAVLDKNTSTGWDFQTTNTRWVLNAPEIVGVSPKSQVGMIIDAARTARETFHNDPEVLVEVLPVLGRALTAMESASVQGSALVREAFDLAHVHYGESHDRTLRARAAVGMTPYFELASARLDLPFLERTSALLAQAYGPFDQRTLGARGASADFVWSALNDGAEAQSQYRALLADADRKLGPLSTDTIELWGTYGAACRHFGSQTETTRVANIILERTKSLSSSLALRYRLRALTWLAIAATDEAEFDRACELLVEAERIKSFDNLTFANDASVVALAMGDLVRATIYTREKLSLVYGNDAEISGIGAKTLTTLARMLAWRGEDLIDAEVATQRAIAAWRNLDVPGDYDWYLYSYMAQASIMRQTGDPEGAERLLRAVLEQRGSFLNWFEPLNEPQGDSCPLAHTGPSWLEILVGTELAAALFDQGKLDEAKHALSFAAWHAEVGEGFSKGKLTSRGWYLAYWTGIIEEAVAKREHASMR